jgi:hypothetical protein
MLKLYFGCALIGATDDFREQTMSLREKLRAHFSVLDFVSLGKGTNLDVYKNDIHQQVATCHLMVAICDHTSTGLGYEMATMVEKYGKPVLAVAYQYSVVSRLILGIDAPFFKFARYNNLDDVVGLLIRFSERHFPK